MECWWYIIGPTNGQIQFALGEYELPSSTLQIYELLLEETIWFHENLISMSIENYQNNSFYMYLSPILSAKDGFVIVLHYSEGWLSRDPVLLGFDGDIKIRGKFLLTMCDQEFSNYE